MINGCSLKKKLFLFTFSILLCGYCCAQNAGQNNGFWQNVQFGGGLGLGFGNNSFNGSISPNAIYRTNEQFGLGAGLNFNYAKFRDAKLLAYGGSLLSLFNPLPEVQLSAELEQLRVHREIEFNGDDLKENYWSPALFLGIGYSNRNVTVGMRYDVLHDPQKSIYANALTPFIRVYF